MIRWTGLAPREFEFLFQVWATLRRSVLPTQLDAIEVRLEREFFIVNLLVRIHYVIVMIRWTGLAPWEDHT